MVFTDYNQLTVIKLSNETNDVPVEILLSALWKRPSCLVYIEVDNRLYGIVTTGRIERALHAGQTNVVINKDFTWISPGEYMRAMQINKERSIGGIPVLNEDRKLLGSYTQGYGLPIFTGPRMFANDSFLKSALKKTSHIALVRPCELFKGKTQLVDEWKEYFDANGISATIIDRTSIGQYLGRSDHIFFADEDELNGTKVLYYHLLEHIGDEDPFLTYEDISHLALPEIYRAVLNPIQEQGIHFLLLGAHENRNSYLKQFDSLIRKKFEDHGLKGTYILPEQMVDGFLADAAGSLPPEQSLPFTYSVNMNNGILTIDDQENPLFFVRHGLRRTVNQPSDYQNCIHMYGPCVIIGPYVEDRHTIASCLQNKLNQAGCAYKVINHGAVNPPKLHELNKILSTDLKKGDIIIWDNYDALDVADRINLTDVVEENALPPEWFVECVRHCNHRVNDVYAEAIYKTLLPAFNSIPSKKESICKDANGAINVGFVDRYFADRSSVHGTVGSIVMNCNPFTFGHRFLIEEALKTVDSLIIFVVEEDSSLFSFRERLAMVRAGVADLQNVVVVPSGEFILSKTTFPEYFIKEKDEYIVRNVENDISLFAEKIAPRLGISYRFVGEEPTDIVTNEYNDAMKRILPSYGINLIEIPRMEKDGSIVSATTVRQCIESGDIERLSKLVPQSTIKHLFLTNA